MFNKNRCFIIICVLLCFVVSAIAGCSFNKKNASSKKVKAPTKQEDYVNYTGYDPKFKQVVSKNGRADLTINNINNDYPIYVRVWSVNPEKPVRALYIKPYDKFTMDNLDQGYYNIRYKNLNQILKSIEKRKTQASFKLGYGSTFSYEIDIEKDFGDAMKSDNFKVPTTITLNVRNGNLGQKKISGKDI